MNGKINITIIIFFFLLGCSEVETTETIQGSKLPKFDLYYYKTKSNKKVPCVIVINDKDVYHGKIKQRGGSSVGYAKKSYTVKLKDKTSVYNMVENESWMLIASYIDKSFMRHKISYELFSSFSPDNVSPKVEYIELFHNKIYRGIYLLTEKIDKYKLNLKDSGAVIFKDCPVFNKSDIIPQEKKSYYQQTYPKVKKKDYTNYMDSLREFILHASKIKFSKEVDSIFDISSIIDWHLMIMLSNNGDAVLKNFYLYRRSKNGKFKIALWDYDSSFGRDADNELNIMDHYSHWDRNTLLNRLYSENVNGYKSKLHNRWKELRKDGKISVENFENRLNNNFQVIKNSLEDNFKKWSVEKSDIYYDSYTFSEEIEVLKKYIRLRIKQLDKELN